MIQTQDILEILCLYATGVRDLSLGLPYTREFGVKSSNDLKRAWNLASECLPWLETLQIDESCFCRHLMREEDFDESKELDEEDWGCLTGMLSTTIKSLVIQVPWDARRCWRDVVCLGGAVTQGRFPRLQTVEVVFYAPHNSSFWTYYFIRRNMEASFQASQVLFRFRWTPDCFRSAKLGLGDEIA